VSWGMYKIPFFFICFSRRRWIYFMSCNDEEDDTLLRAYACI
jgi:hypothetical protein